MQWHWNGWESEISTLILAQKDTCTQQIKAHTHKSEIDLSIFIDDTFDLNFPSALHAVSASAIAFLKK